MITPVALICHKRPEHTARALERIAAVKPPRFIVISDGPRSAAEREAVGATRALVERLPWKTDLVREYTDENLGCPQRTCTGLDTAFHLFEEVIILEDDTLPDLSFFPYCGDLLVASPWANLVKNIGFGEDAALTADQNPLADRPTEPVSFPLRHPPLELDLALRESDVQELDAAFYRYGFSR
ncbi:MAG: hypothetical protein CMJ84_04115 [Planctomycetes bacterium]|jgi:hypothetical protein|nr:hypothetical protein [Planctomycetota bacterium]MDP6410015.1 hypothetical protein [Planctomycetota bacterium]